MKKIGIALSGGAARGFAHLGVLKVLVEHNIPIDYIAGCSAGSFAGAAFAAGMSVDEIIEVGKKISWYRMSRLSFSARGILSNTPIGDLVRNNFPVTKFEDLKIPFAANATNLETGKEKIFRDSGVFAPLQDADGNFYVDGGVVAPVPTKAVKKLGAEIVIAVDVLSSGATYWGTPTTMLGVFFQSAIMLLRTAAKHQHYRADIVIIPEIAHLRPDEIGKMDEFIEAGERAALEKIDEIKKLISGEE
jgi:NTE family protein